MKGTLRQAARDARVGLGEMIALLKETAGSAWGLCAALYLLPELLMTAVVWPQTSALFAQWEALLQDMLSGSADLEALLMLAMQTSQTSQEATMRTALVTLLSSFFLVPLLNASLAQMNLARLKDGMRLSANDAASQTLHDWKSLLFLAFLSMILTELLSLLPYFAITAISFVTGLLAMIPGIADVVTIAGLAIALAVQAAFQFAVQAAFSFVWLAAVGEGARGMAAFGRSVRLFRIRPGVVLLANLAVQAVVFVLMALIYAAWLAAFFAGGAPLRVLQLAEPLVQAAALPVSCALSAVLYVRLGGRGADDPYGAPRHLHDIRSANLPEDRA